MTPQTVRAAALARARARLTVRLASGLVGAVLLLAPPGVTAQEPEAVASPQPKLATALSIDFETARMEGLPHYITARLVAADGSAVVAERVSIRRVADAFGGLTVTLGRASTDNAGIARVAVEPREPVYAITASFGGSETHEASELSKDVAFPPDVVNVPRHAPQGGIVDPQLRPLADTMPVVIGLVVIAVWALLISMTLLTLARIRSAGRGEPSAPASPHAEVSGTGPGSQGWDP